MAGRRLQVLRRKSDAAFSFVSKSRRERLHARRLEMRKVREARARPRRRAVAASVRFFRIGGSQTAGSGSALYGLPPRPPFALTFISENLSGLNPLHYLDPTRRPAP